MKVYTVKNRTAVPFTGMFDGVVYEVPAAGTLALPDFIAFHMKRQSVCRLNPVSGEATFRLAIVELGDEDDPIGEIPEELLDRTDMDLSKTRILKMNNRPAVPQRREAAGSAITSKEREV